MYCSQQTVGSTWWERQVSKNVKNLMISHDLALENMLHRFLLLVKCWCFFYRLREKLHEELRKSGIREQLEARVRELVDQSGGADNVDLTDLRDRLRYPASSQETVQTIENSLAERVQDFTITCANNLQLNS